MGNYTTVSVQNYNDDAPTDDGATTEANRGKWATVLSEIGNPLKTAVEAINTSLLSLLNNNSLGYASDTGTANTYACAVASSVAAYAEGQKFRVKIANANTGASTLNVNSLGAKTIQSVKGGTLAALTAGELVVGQIAQFEYNGSVFVLTNPTLRKQYLNTVLAKTGAYTIVLADRGKLVTADGTFTITLPSVATAGAGFSVVIMNIGTGQITVDANASESINEVLSIQLYNQWDAVTLVCDGVQWNASFSAGTSTGGQLLGVASASNDASVSFQAGAAQQLTDDWTQFSRIELHLQNVIPATDSVEAWVRIADVTSTWLTANYAWARTSIDDTGAVGDQGATSQAEFGLFGTGVIGSDTNEIGISGVVTLHHPMNSSRTVMTFVGTVQDTSSRVVHVMSSCIHQGIVTAESIQFLFSSDNIESGRFQLRGYR